MRSLLRAGLVIALVLAVRPVSADFVTLDFSGTISGDTTGLLPSGTPFSGTLEYDSTYNVPGFDFGGSAFPHSISLTVGTFSYTTQGSSFRVMPGDTTLRVLVQAPNFFNPPAAPNVYNQVELDLTATSSIFPTGLLPDSQTFIDAASTLTGTALFRNAHFGSSTITQGPLTTISAVPEPAALSSLLLAGIVVTMGGLGRKQRNAAGRTAGQS